MILALYFPTGWSTVIQDLFVPSVTPFADDGTIHVDALIAHCDWLLSSGASGLMLFGTTGEGPSLSVAEKVDDREGGS